jgi:LEA14-like dessication related protein
MNLKPVIALGLMGGLGYLAWRFYSRQKQLLEQYEVRPLGVKVIKWKPDVATVEFTVRITNKAAIEATVTSMYADVYLMDQFMGNLENSGGVVIPAHGSSDAKMQITFAPQQVLKNAVSAIGVLLQTKDIPYRLKGYAKIKSSFIAVSVPFDYKGNLKSDLLG